MVGSSRISRSGSWISAQHSPSFCFMPPESLPAGRSANGARPVLVEQLGDAALALAAVVAEQAAEEVDVLEHRQRRVEVLAQALRHVGDARADDAGGDRRRPCRRRAPRPGPSAPRARRRSATAGSTCRHRPGRSARPCSPRGCRGSPRRAPTSRDSAGRRRASARPDRSRSRSSSASGQSLRHVHLQLRRPLARSGRAARRPCPAAPS